MSVERRGFLAALVTAPAAAAAAWASVTKAEPQKELARPDETPACTLNERDEIWTLEDGTMIPVHCINMTLDFEPLLTWTENPDDQFNLSGKQTPPPPKPFQSSKPVIRFPARMVFSRIDENMLQQSHFWVDEIKPHPRSNSKAHRENLEAAIAATSIEDMVRRRLGTTLHGSKFKDADPQGVVAVIHTPDKIWYSIAVVPVRMTSANLVLQAPARAIFV